MKPTDVIDEIVEKGKLEDRSIGTLTEWIIANEGKRTIAKYLSAIREDEIITLTPEGKMQGKIVFKRLQNSPFFNGLAIKYGWNKWFDEAEKIFIAILARTPKDMDSVLNYGASIAGKIVTLYRKEKNIDKSEIEKARKLCFSANAYDRKVHDDWRIKPAYKNLCYLRALEAIYYFNKKETFTAFTLAWVSIEMSLYRMWFKFLSKKSAKRMDELMKWNTESIIETLLLSEADETYKKVKDNIDIVKGIRHSLLHGKINNPTLGHTKLCLETALSLTDILQK